MVKALELKPKQANCLSCCASDGCIRVLGIFTILSKLLLVSLASMALYNLTVLAQNAEETINPDSLVSLRLSDREILPQNISAWLGGAFVSSETEVKNDRCDQENCVSGSLFEATSVGPFTAAFMVLPRFGVVVPVLFASLAIDLTYAVVAFVMSIFEARVEIGGTELCPKLKEATTKRPILIQTLLLLPSLTLTVAVISLQRSNLFEFGDHAGWVTDEGANQTLRVRAVDLTGELSGLPGLIEAKVPGAAFSQWCSSSQTEFSQVEAAIQGLQAFAEFRFCNVSEWVFDDDADCITSVCDKRFVINDMQWFDEVFEAVQADLSANILLDALLTVGEMIALIVSLYVYYKSKSTQDESEKT